MVDGASTLVFHGALSPGMIAELCAFPKEPGIILKPDQSFSTSKFFHTFYSEFTLLVVFLA